MTRTESKGQMEALLPWLMFALFRAGEILIAAMFWDAVPAWRVLTWWILVAVSGSTADLLTDTLFPKKPEDKHQIWPFWFNAICFGSAVFLLYVPGNLGLNGLLNVALLCIGALFALQSVAGAPTTVPLAVLLPTSLRYLTEGERTSFLLGLGGIMISAALVAVAHHARQMLEEQRRLREQAERAVEAVASVNLAKARFFAAASHDLRQPVHAIGLYAEFLKGFSTATPQQKQAVEGIRQAWKSLDTLLNEVLDLTKLDANAMEPQFQSVDTSDLLRDIIQQHIAMAEAKRIRLVILGERPGYVHADLLMLQRAVSNVLANAIKFSPPGSRIALLARRARLNNQPAWRIQVRDAGPGIAPTEQERIFEEFIQTHNAARQSAKGYGLGLAIAKRFCAAMGGVIHVRSAPGKGSTMEIILAAAQPNMSKPIQIDRTAQSVKLAPIGQGQEILLVEDDPLVVDGMSLLMREWGFQVQHAEDAATALQLNPKASIALCDVRLPGAMSGYELALRLRENASMQVMLMSGETDSALREQAKTSGLPFLVKPVAATHLHAALLTLIQDVASLDGPSAQSAHAAEPAQLKQSVA